MFLNDVIPCPALSAYVRLYRIMNFSFAATETLPFKAYPPRIENCLQFFPKDPEIIEYASGKKITGIKTALVGQHTMMNRRYVGNNFLNFQVEFQPGALSLLTGIPSLELTNHYYDAAQILGPGVCNVNEKLFHAADKTAMVHIVEQYLLQLVKNSVNKNHPVDAIAKMMLLQPGKHSIDWYAQQSCLCNRQFDRKFKERMGVSPKTFESIHRFDTSFRIKYNAPGTDWLSIALQSGFHDHQHLAKSYKNFTGYSPGDFFELEKKAPERYTGDV